MTIYKNSLFKVKEDDSDASDIDSRSLQDFFYCKIFPSNYFI